MYLSAESTRTFWHFLSHGFLSDPTSTTSVSYLLPGLFLYSNEQTFTGHMVISHKQNNPRRSRGQLRSTKTIGQTLISCKVAARRLIFKQVLKLQILIRAIGSTEVFLQILFVVEGGHLSDFLKMIYRLLWEQS